MTYDPDQKGRPFKPLYPQKPEVDPVTESIYYSRKRMLAMVGGRMDILNPAQKKHFETSREFVDGFEAHAIKFWGEYFETPEQYVKRWNSYTPEQHKRMLKV